MALCITRSICEYLSSWHAVLSVNIGQYLFTKSCLTLLTPAHFSQHTLRFFISLWSSGATVSRNLVFKRHSQSKECWLKRGGAKHVFQKIHFTDRLNNCNLQTLCINGVDVSQIILVQLHNLQPIGLRRYLCRSNAFSIKKLNSTRQKMN